MEKAPTAHETSEAVRLSGIELGAVAIGARGLGVVDFDLTVSTAGGGKEIIVQATDDIALAS